MDTEELGFRAGEVIEVMDMTDKDWWWGRMASSEGWFPAAFVRLRANQMETADDLAQKLKEGEIDSTTAMRRYSCNTLLSKEQARTNVVREILHAEKEYIRHISDVIEGYIEKASKRPEMFSAEMLRRIFGNMEEIHKFSAAFLRDLEVCIRNDKPQSSEIGACFIKHQKGFEIYSEYCNNHPIAIEELRLLQKDSRYHQFFEACRLLQQMINIPLEGFLLNPVQKICKYPLQLKELLKHTRPEHPDYEPLKEALDTMKQIALLINERKRKMESLEKLAEWQDTVENWQGEDLIDISSELIFSGEMTKVNRNGGNQERIYFLFDNQLVYCRKDKLWRDVMVYKGRIGTNSCQVIPLQDGKDNATGTTVKNAFSIYDNTKEKSYVLCCRTALERERWLSALRDERKRVEMDKMNGFNLQEFKAKMASIFCHTRQRARNKGNKLKKSQMIIPDAVLSHSQNNNSPASSHRSKTLHRSHNTSSLMTPTMSSHPKTPVKRSWFPFKSRKN
ncbi:hypothetical protein CAPTEDRAFT_180035 [Capitella teleta]|uniref:Rho guanine nucleotide exchange factor 4 n=1 Tax=Capitella teleta TaxID=283909 RepID=R7TV20_CAPTE|nr:hypothetical protein CAPTEDRAFT_180035 [Capitella teleta]|eukprot:ELT97753.1 hypothetical protein CAPTEDRAFT_180035 [Capitella teleta]